VEGTLRSVLLAERRLRRIDAGRARRWLRHERTQHWQPTHELSSLVSPHWFLAFARCIAYVGDLFAPDFFSHSIESSSLPASSFDMGAPN
jgi:hypothetical protein